MSIERKGPAVKTPYNVFAWIYTLPHLFPSSEAERNRRQRPTAAATVLRSRGRHSGCGEPAGELHGNPRGLVLAAAKAEPGPGSSPA